MQNYNPRGDKQIQVTACLPNNLLQKTKEPKHPRALHTTTTHTLLPLRLNSLLQIPIKLLPPHPRLLLHPHALRNHPVPIQTPQ